MEGKKIAFIVVAIATVGGIAYYLNKKNKDSIATLNEPTYPIKPSVVDVYKFAEPSSQIVKGQSIPIVAGAYEDENGYIGTPRRTYKVN